MTKTTTVLLDNFQRWINELHLSELNSNHIINIIERLDQANTDLSSSFISQSVQSLCTLEQWAWRLLGQCCHTWATETNYFQLFRTLASFNRNLIIHYDQIEIDTKGNLLIPGEIGYIDNLFDEIQMNIDENDPFLTLVCLWLDNLSLFLRDHPQYCLSDVIQHVNNRIGRDWVMTDQYRQYLRQLGQIPLLPSSFTTQQLFYLKTCSFSLSSYLFATIENVPFHAEDLFNFLGTDYVSIFLLHTHTIVSWTVELLACLTHVTVLISACCWWGGQKGSQTHILFPTESLACQYIDGLIRIISCQSFYPSIVSQRTNDQTMLIDTSLFTMKNIAQNQDFIWFLRSKNSLPDALLTIAETSKCDQISLGVYSILSEILSDERLKELEIPGSACIFFFTILEQAWHHPMKRYKLAPISFLLRSFVSLVKTDAMQQQIAETRKLTLLIEISDEYPVVFDIIWALSFNEDIQEQLRSNSSFMTKLAHPSRRSDDEQVRKMIHGILWNLENIHDERKTSDYDNDHGMFDVMISYSHKDQHLCRQIYDALVAHGYRVWIDFDQMHGNVMDAMAKAIERSHTILVCMSEQYRRSSYCRAEAHYAFQRQLRIVPILVQQHYQPDSWLLFLIGQLVFVDFTRHELTRAIELLIKELPEPMTSKRLVLSVTSHDTDTDKNESILPNMTEIISLSNNIANWSSADVNGWLVQNDLIQLSHLFKNMDGQGLLYLYESIQKLELQQCISLLHEDALRRTNQSLSLVEINCFRSLMDKRQSDSASTLPHSRKAKRKRNTFCCII